MRGNRWGIGEESARNQLFERVYTELKRIARSQIRRSGDWISVNPTTLLHEAWIKFARTDGRELQGSAHFYNILSQAMRHVLTDIARSRVTTKRGHQFVRVELNERIEQPETSLAELLAVDSALEKLQACDAELAQLVEWHFFGGISFVDIAKIRDYCLNLSHPRGRHKARVFQASLGITVDDSEELRWAFAPVCMRQRRSWSF